MFCCRFVYWQHARWEAHILFLSLLLLLLYTCASRRAIDLASTDDLNDSDLQILNKLESSSDA
jgi:hypothetical protein